MFDRAQMIAREVSAYRALGLARPRRKLPVQQPPIMIEREYARELIALLVPRIKTALAPLYAELPNLLARAAAERRHDAMRLDAGESKRARKLIEEARAKIQDGISTADIEALAEKFAQRTATYQKVQLARQTKAALGVDVHASDAKLPPLINAFTDANVGLIKDIGDNLARKVELKVMHAVQTGMLHGDLAKELEALGFGEKRAKLIARDQIGKLYGQLNASRQTALGIDEFIWRSVHDQRVRPLHRTLEGKKFYFSKGGHPGEGLPGEPVLCRCYAEPVLDSILGDLSEPVAAPRTRTRGTAPSETPKRRRIRNTPATVAAEAPAKRRRAPAAPKRVRAPIVPMPKDLEANKLTTAQMVWDPTFGRGAASKTPSADKTPRVPPGFSTSAVSDGLVLFDAKPIVRAGVPSFAQLRTQDYRKNVYVVHPSDLTKHPLFGIDTGGANPADPRTTSIRKAWNENKELPAIEIDIDKNGGLFIADGNHRLWAAAFDGNRPIAVRFRPSSQDDVTARMDPVAEQLQAVLSSHAPIVLTRP